MYNLMMTKQISGKSSRKSLKGQAQENRELALNEIKRNLILAAAKEAFLELGLDGASLREIAKRSGYTPGAIYSYFSSREEIYAVMLSDSLEKLRQEVAKVGTSPAKKTKAALYQLLAEQAMAFFMFYYNHPQDMDLGFYLFNGAQPKGLTPELNQKLNAALRLTLNPVENTLITLGFSKAQAVRKTTAIFGHAVGLLILHNTGRIRIFKQDAKELFKDYLKELV